MSIDEIPAGGLRPSAGVNVIERSLGWFWLEDDGVVRGRLRPNQKVTKEQAYEILDAYRELGHGRPIVALVDLANVRRGSNSVRSIMAGPEGAALHRAAALLVRSPVGRVLANAFMRLQRPPYPTKAFAIEAMGEALEWLYARNDPTP